MYDRIHTQVIARFRPIAVVVLLAYLAIPILPGRLSSGQGVQTPGEDVDLQASQKRLSALLDNLAEGERREETEREIWVLYKERNQAFAERMTGAFSSEHYSHRRLQLLPQIAQRLPGASDQVMLLLLTYLEKSGEMGSPEHTKLLQRIALSQRPEEIRGMAVDILGEWHVSSSLETLAALSRHAEASIRAAATLALAKFEERDDVRELLIERMRDREPSIRVSAAVSLSKNYCYFPALDVLFALLECEEPDVRRVANVYLEQLTGLELGRGLVLKKLSPKATRLEFLRAWYSLGDKERQQHSENWDRLWRIPDHPLRGQVVAMWQDWWQENKDYAYFGAMKETQIRINDDAKRIKKKVNRYSGIIVVPSMKAPVNRHPGRP